MTEYSDDDLRMMALVEALLSLSEDNEHAGTVKLYGPTGQFVGDVKLSAREIAVLTESVSSLGNQLRLFTEQSGGLPEVDEADVNDLIAGAEALVNGEQS